MKKNDVVNEINKSAGKTVAYMGSDLDEVVHVRPTGMISLDKALVCGGMPVGRFVEIHGLQSSSKTSLCFAMIAKYQRDGLTCAFIDAEYALDPVYAKGLGVDMDSLIIIQPDCGEEAFEAVEKLVRSKKVHFIVVDSCAALVPRGVIEAEHGKPTMASTARLMSQGLSKLVGPLGKSEATVVFINQMRMNIMGGQYDPYTVTGGMALRFYTTIILELKRDKAIEVDGDLAGYKIKVKVRKNKVGRPGQECLIELRFEGGFSAEADLLSLCLEAGVIQRLGNTYSLGELRLGIGQNKVKEFLATNPAVVEELQTLLSPTP